MTSIKDMVKDGQKVKFQFYKQNELWYKTETGFDFPVPISDTGDGIFLAEDKAMFFMRYIKKHIKFLEDAKNDYVPLVEHPLTMTETVKALVSESIQIDQHRGYGSVEE